MKLTLTKTITKEFDLKPYGKFSLKFLKGKPRSINTIDVKDTLFEHETAMPLDEVQEKLIIDLMKEHKTDILTDGSYNGFYTRTSSGLTRVWHPKLGRYRDEEGFKVLIDNGHSF